MSAGIRYAQAEGAVVVAAAGNTFETVAAPGTLPYPARLPGVVAVSGINRALRHDGGSTLSTIGKAVSIAAPMTTTDSTGGYPDVGLPAAQNRTGIAKGLTYDLHSAGTSWSAPIVSGIVALIRAAHPSMNADSVVNTLLRTATPAGSGRPNRTYGYGIVDAAAAVDARPPAVGANPLIDPAAGAAVSTAPGGSSAGAAVPGTTAPATTATASTTAPGPSAPAASRSDGSSVGVWIAGAAVAAAAVAAALLGVRRRRAR